MEIVEEKRGEGEGDDWRSGPWWPADLEMADEKVDHGGGRKRVIELERKERGEN